MSFYIELDLQKQSIRTYMDIHPDGEFSLHGQRVTIVNDRSVLFLG